MPGGSFCNSKSGSKRRKSRWRNRRHEKGRDGTRREVSSSSSEDETRETTPWRELELYVGARLPVVFAVSTLATHSARFPASVTVDRCGRERARELVYRGWTCLACGDVLKNERGLPPRGCHASSQFLF